MENARLSPPRWIPLKRFRIQGNGDNFPLMFGKDRPGRWNVLFSVSIRISYRVRQNVISGHLISPLLVL